MLGLSVDKNMFHAAILLYGGDVVYNFQFPSPAESYLDCLLAVSNDVTTLESRAPLHHTTGIALPSVMLDNIMQNAPLGCLNGKAIKQDLQHSLGREVAICSYGTCCTLYGALYGAGHDAETVFSMHIDTKLHRRICGWRTLACWCYCHRRKLGASAASIPGPL